jgi:hypothetical protein
MTEAAQRKAAATPARPARPASRLPVSRPVLWTGIALGAFLAAEALLLHRLVLPLGLPGFAGAAITAVLIVALAVVAAELTRRHHRTVARHAIRHGKRGAAASARHARRHGGTALQWLVAKAAPRWENREHRPLMFRRLRGHEATATRRVDGKPETDADKRFFDLRASGYTGPVNQDGYAVSDPPPDDTDGGTTSMTVSKITPGRRARRTAAHAGGGVPSEWGPVVAQAADFEPESDGDLLGWMAGQVTGMAAYAEALIEAYETGVGAVGIDPKGLAALHDVADAAAHAAETMSGASKKFADHYELPREFAANGGLMTHDGRWVTGEGA